MICIVKIKNNEADNSPEPTAWILAHDIHDARKQAYDASERDLAAQLYQVPDNVKPGSYELSDGLWLIAN